jgi:hypothetical protein
MGAKWLPLFVSGKPHESDPEFYKRDDYWLGVTVALVVVPLEHNELAQQIVLEARRRGVAVEADKDQDKEDVRVQLDKFLQSAA